MTLEDFFLQPDKGFYRFAWSDDVDATVYEHNPSFYHAVLTDLRACRGKEKFVYFAGWWSDLRLPLGDPRARPAPPTLGESLQALSAPSTSGAADPAGAPQVCCMLWQHKNQVDLGAAPSYWAAPDSLVGAPILGAINTATVRTVNKLPGGSRGILDKRHAFAGSHHQKFIVMLTAAGLVAHVGSSDFNTDRLYAPGDRGAPVAPGKGAPLNDVNVRLTGRAAFDVLTSFVHRWQGHPEGKATPLTGAGYTPKAPVDAPRRRPGTTRAQLSHTYATGYPFSTPVRSAADTHLSICRAAQRYVYFEDQYLIGTPELSRALRDKLVSNIDFAVLAVMAPLSVVGDLRWLNQRRTDFWLPLATTYPHRVLLFEMLAPDGSDSGPGAYLHNKMTLADDVVVTLGSVNFSRRSHTHDSEIMVTLGGRASSASERDLAHDVRISRWARHLGTRPDPRMGIADAIAAMRRPSPAARIRPWVPTPYTMSIAERYIYQRAYDTVLDPA